MKTLSVIILLSCLLSLSHGQQITLKNILSNIETRFNKFEDLNIKIEAISNHIKQIMNDNKKAKQDYDVFKQSSTKDISALRQEVNTLKDEVKRTSTIQSNIEDNDDLILVDVPFDEVDKSILVDTYYEIPIRKDETV